MRKYLKQHKQDWIQHEKTFHPYKTEKELETEYYAEFGTTAGFLALSAMLGYFAGKRK